ncbi:MAG: DUF4382 domain-containing protein, partial [Steroidobacteraceae bacterium]
MMRLLRGRASAAPGRARRVRPGVPAALALAVACAALAACQPRTNVAATANIPASYSHVWLTVHEVQFNSSATAAATDAGWQSFPLSAPQTIDLAAATNGALSQFASNLSLPAGTYHQMRVVLADATDTLASSAQSAGATYNDEVEYTDGSGADHQVPLEIPNAAQGIGFAIDLTVSASDKAALAALGCAVGGASAAGSFGATATFGNSTSSGCASSISSATATSQCGSGYFFDSTTGTCELNGTPIGTAAASTGTTVSPTTQCAVGSTFDATQGQCVATSASNSCLFGSSSGTSSSSGCTSTSLNTAATTSTAIDFDAARGLAPYTASGQSGFLLIPHLTGYDLSQVGTIQGQVSIAALAAGVGDVEVTAETLSSDGSRHIAVLSAPLRSDGSFVLYPVSTASGSPSQYDLVIHGAGIGTVIVRAVPVSSGSPSSAASASLTNIALAGSSTFPVEVAPASPVAPRGAIIGFYQTLPASGEVPYLIDAQPVDPFTGTFDSDRSLPSADPAYGTYASGSTVLTAAAPSEGSATYHVAASAPLYG